MNIEVLYNITDADYNAMLDIKSSGTSGFFSNGGKKALDVELLEKHHKKLVDLYMDDVETYTGIDGKEYELEDVLVKVGDKLTKRRIKAKNE